MTGAVASSLVGLEAAACAVLLGLSLPAMSQSRRAKRVQARLATTPSGLSGAGTVPGGPYPPRPPGRFVAPGWFVRRLGDLAVTTEPTRVWSISVLVAGVAPLLGLAVGGLALAAVVGLFLVGAVAVVIDIGRHRSERLVDQELPAVLDAISNATRSGLSLIGALAEAARQARGPVRGDLLVAAAVAERQGIMVALSGWSDQRPTAGVRLSVAALSLSAELGGVTRPIDGIAMTIRDRLAVEREARALSAQARSSAFVVIAAPFVFVVLMGFSDRSVFSFFARSSLGLACLAGGVTADGLGAWWMLRLLRSSK